MRNVTLQSPGQLVFAEANDATKPEPGHAIVRVSRVGICGTDWHAFAGRQPFFSYPRVLGHELGVIVESLDPVGQTDIRVGDRCSVEPYLNCGTCIACRRGRTNCCVNMRVLGVHVDGGMRDRFSVPISKLHPSRTLSLDQLALVETLAIGCHAVNRANVQQGDSVLVLGAGPIGLSLLPFLHVAGAKTVVADVSADRLAFAASMAGVAHAVQSDDQLAARLRDLNDGDLPVAVIDATGNAGSMQRCFELADHGGRIVYVGLGQFDISFNDPNFHRRELSLHASRNALPGDFTRIISLIEQGKIDTTPWITHRCVAGEVPDRISDWSKNAKGLLKAMIDWSE